jgi:hypothetical protein
MQCIVPFYRFDEYYYFSITKALLFSYSRGRNDAVIVSILQYFKGTDNDYNRDKKDRKGSAMSYSLMDLEWSEISEFMSSSLPLFKDIMLILKGLLHNFPS